MAVKRSKKSGKRGTLAPSKTRSKPSRAVRSAAVPSRNGDARQTDEGLDSLSDSGGNKSNGEVPVHPRRRATAHSMAAKQRDISVSEFFAKNRHLLGFDNPRKALLTTVKEAVDNSLDACEEAGILPEIWVHIEPTGTDRYKVGVQDNGPGILKKQIPLIFGKLLYGSKFHRLRQSRGQQGIGISAAGMYGVQTTGKPVKIISKVGANKSAHYYEIQIDTKKNEPQILNGRGEGVEVPPGKKGDEAIAKHGIEWEHQPHGTRVTIELQAKYVRGRASVDEYLEQTAIANPHVTLHYKDPDGNVRDYARSADHLPVEPKEIKPHPYGVELGRLITLLHDNPNMTVAQFLMSTFSRVTGHVARKICNAANISTRSSTRRIGRKEADSLYQAIQATRIAAPATD
ncbi:MAG TPA: DNA topoisomerase VI subunit B, partial [Lacipirellulaceae bacterium]|nr:DNA topoisomerase VI subunit B [Lacipirellulaceae bacterium]